MDRSVPEGVVGIGVSDYQASKDFYEKLHAANR